MLGVAPYAFIDDQGGYFSLPSQFDKLGRPAVPALLELLNHADWTMRARAGMALAGLGAVETKDLPALIRESRNGNPWIVPALGRLGTPEAISELVDVLRRSPTLDQALDALKALGKETVPFALKALTCETDRDCSQYFVEAMGMLGASPGVQSPEIQERLVAISASGKYSRYITVGALLGLKDWQPYQESARLSIRPLLDSATQEIRSAAIETLVSWRDAAGLPPLIEAIENADRHERYRLVALLETMGPVAAPAGPMLVSKLRDDDWNLRRVVAQALGKIAYMPAASELASSITPADWKLTYAAMISLAQLGPIEGVSAIREVADAYWQPGMRLAAQAVRDGKVAPVSPIAAYCANSMEPASLDSQPDLLDATGAADTLFLPGGRLVAVDGGEWAGGLEFWPEIGLPFDVIKDDDMVAVLRSEHGIFALSGTALMDGDDGFIYRVGQDSEGKWSAQRIWRLPGAPRAVSYTPGGTIGIATNYGDVIFRPDSGMEWISCPARE